MIILAAVIVVLFNDTIQRFRDSVETNRLRAVKFDNDDFEKIYKGMSLSSNYLHDRARGKGEREAPEPGVLKEEVRKLEEFVSTKREQLKMIKKQR